jgi:hypothetical protein
LPYLVGGLTRITGFLHDIQSQRYLNAAAKLLCLHKSCISSRVWGSTSSLCIAHLVKTTVFLVIMGGPQLLRRCYALEFYCSSASISVPNLLIIAQAVQTCFRSPYATSALLNYMFES